MPYGRKALPIGSLLIAGLVSSFGANAQQNQGQSCAETMTEQLRRFSEQCLSDVVSFVASQPKMAARVSSESERFYVVIARDGDRLRADAVSKFNYPLMKDETAVALKQLGWNPPENESDNWRKFFGSDRANASAAGEEVAKALEAYGLNKGQAIALTVGADIPGLR